jgi:hypothetical protein
MTSPATPSLFDNALLSLPPQCIVEVAADIEELVDIAPRWGMTLKELEKALASPTVRMTVEQKRAELRSSGVTFRMKMAVMAEELAQDIYRKAVDPDTGLSSKLEVAKWMAKLADLEPRPNAQQQAGPGFSITINLGQGQAPMTLTAQPQPVLTPVQTIDHEDDAPALQVPSYLRDVVSRAELEDL